MGISLETAEYKKRGKETVECPDLRSLGLGCLFLLNSSFCKKYFIFFLILIRFLFYSVLFIKA